MTSHLFSQCFHWGDVDTAAFCVVQQHPQNSKLCADRLSTAGGSSHKHIIITVVHCVEHWKERNNTTKSRKQCEVDSPKEPTTLPLTYLFEYEMMIEMY